MSNMRREMADDGIGIFDLRFSPNFHKRFAGYDKREVELYIRRQEAIMTKIRLEKEQLERQVIRLRQQVANSKEQLAEARAQADAAKAELAIAKAENPHTPETDVTLDAEALADTATIDETQPTSDESTGDGEEATRDDKGEEAEANDERQDADTKPEAEPETEEAEPEAEEAAEVSSKA